MSCSSYMLLLLNHTNLCTCSPGIAVCGAGVGCLIFAPVGPLLTDTYDWKSAMFIIAAIILNCFAAGKQESVTLWLSDQIMVHTNNQLTSSTLDLI